MLYFWKLYYNNTRKKCQSPGHYAQWTIILGSKSKKLR